MSLCELNDTEFKATFCPPMKDVTSRAEEIVDLWSYADRVLEAAFRNSPDWDWQVKHIYESGDGAFQHVLVPVPGDNTYMVIVIDKALRKIKGHHQLDLGALYGIEKR